MPRFRLWAQEFWFAFVAAGFEPVVESDEFHNLSHRRSQIHQVVDMGGRQQTSSMPKDALSRLH